MSTKNKYQLIYIYIIYKHNIIIYVGISVYIYMNTCIYIYGLYYRSLNNNFKWAIFFTGWVISITRGVFAPPPS